MKHRKAFRRHQNRSFHPVPGRTWKVSYLLSMWCPVCRRRDSDSGSRAELENLAGDAKGKGTSGESARPKVPMHRSGSDCSIVVMKRGNARGAKGAGHRHLARVNRQREEPDFQWKAAAFAQWHEPDDARVKIGFLPLPVGTRFSMEGGSLRAMARAG